MPLTADQIQIIKATIPILKEGGVALTTKFYQNMLGANPSVRPMFNPAHQASGMQPKALAHSLLLYATYIDDLGQLKDLVERIVSKHVTLLVLPEQYDIVGKYLILTMKEVLGDIATDAVIDAWTAAYTDLATILIDLEEKRYQSFEWRGYREFVVKEKVQESPEVVSVYMVPKDGKPLTPGKPGQYIGIKFSDDEVFSKFEGSVRREYSLSDISDGKSFRISVKRIPGGAASGYVHDNLKVGDTVEITPPAGGLLYDSAASPQKEVVLLAGGIGITPLIPIAKQILDVNPAAKITLVNSLKVPDNQPFTSEFKEIVSHSEGKFKIVNYYSQADPASISSSSSYSGRLSKKDLDGIVASKEDTLVYYLGPVGYMVSVAKYLKELGVPEENTRREFFFPDQSLVIEVSA